MGAWLLDRAGLCPQLICLGHLDTPGARRVRRQLGRRALILGQPDLRAPAIVERFRALAPDALLSWFWPKQIPASLLALPRLGAYGVHPSLLPRWRGPDPYFWTLYAGDLHAGVSLHVLEPEYDTGAVIMQQRLRVAERDDAWSLARRLDRLSLALLLEAARALRDGDAALNGAPQPRPGASQAPVPEESLLSIDWSADAAHIVRLIRAAAPNPGALAELGNATVEVLRAGLCARELPRALQPAEAVWLEGQVVVQTGAGGVVLERVRTEDGELLSGAEIARLFAGSLTRF
jgi:methionyl-tRNA formyltransferase